MSDVKLIYRDQMIRAVMGTRPAMLAKEADTTALDRMCRRLVETEEAHQLLRAKGYGKAGMTIVELVRLLPPASS